MIAPSVPPLQLDVFVGSKTALQPTSTLVYGQQTAVLIDAQFTQSDAANLVRRMAARGRRLTTIYITNAHPDHYFGLQTVMAAFPNAYVCSAPEVIEEIDKTGAAKLAQWRRVFKNEMPSEIPHIEVLTDHALTVDGHVLRIMHIGQGDHHSTMIHLPTQGTLIAGDLLCNGTHVRLAETDAASREQWLRNLEAIRSIDPITLVAGHKRSSNPPDKASVVLNTTREYITDFHNAVESGATPAHVITTMLGKYGDLELPNVLEMSAHAAFAAVA